MDGFFKGFFTAFLFLGVLGLITAVGFHTANEILPGTFTGNYTFSGSVEGKVFRVYNETSGLINGAFDETNGIFGSYVSVYGQNHSGHPGKVWLVGDIRSADTYGGTINLAQYNGTHWPIRLHVSKNGTIGIGTINPIAKLSVAGNITAEAICDEAGANCKDISSGWSSSDWVCGDGSMNWPNGATVLGTVYDLEICQKLCDTGSYRYCTLQGPYGASYACAGGNGGWVVNGVDTCYVDLG